MMDNSFIPFDPWMGNAFAFTDFNGDEWVNLPMQIPMDPETGEVDADHPFWNPPDSNSETEITFIHPGKMTTGPEYLVGKAVIDFERAESFLKDGGEGYNPLRPISPEDRDSLGENEVYLKLGSLCYAAEKEENDCSTLVSTNGLMIFTDWDEDGVIDHIDWVGFNGKRNSWEIPVDVPESDAD